MACSQQSQTTQKQVNDKDTSYPTQADNNQESFEQAEADEPVDEPIAKEPVEEPVAKEPVEKPEAKEPVNQNRVLAGQIQLNQEQLRRQNAQLDKTVIYFQPKEMDIKQLPQQTHTITTENKRFKPDVLAITRDSTVQFPVKDTILHNVFSVTPGTNFDLGLYSKGTTKEHVFEYDYSVKAG